MVGVVLNVSRNRAVVHNSNCINPMPFKLSNREDGRKREIREEKKGRRRRREEEEEEKKKDMFGRGSSQCKQKLGHRP